MDLVRRPGQNGAVCAEQEDHSDRRDGARHHGGQDVVPDVVNSGTAIPLDVRDVGEWIAEGSSPCGMGFCPRKGRISGAKWIEWYRMMMPIGSGLTMKAPSVILAERASVDIPVETPVVLDGFKGARASKTFGALNETGVRDVRLYFGCWIERSHGPGLPIERGVPQSSQWPLVEQAGNWGLRAR